MILDQTIYNINRTSLSRPYFRVKLRTNFQYNMLCTKITILHNHSITHRTQFHILDTLQYLKDCRIRVSRRSRALIYLVDQVDQDQIRMGDRLSDGTTPTRVWHQRTSCSICVQVHTQFLQDGCCIDWQQLQWP